MARLSDLQALPAEAFDGTEFSPVVWQGQTYRANVSTLLEQLMIPVDANGNAFAGGAGNDNCTGTDNAASGFEALGGVGIGIGNTATGRATARANQDGNYNADYGNGCALLVPGGDFNARYGYNAQGEANQPSSRNAIFGAFGGRYYLGNEFAGFGFNVGGNLTIGVRFTGGGTGAGATAVENDAVTALGWGADISVAARDAKFANMTAIGHQAIADHENQVALGDNQVRELKLFGRPFIRGFGLQGGDDLAPTNLTIGPSAGNRTMTGGGLLIAGYEAAAGVTNDERGIYLGYLNGNQARGNRAFLSMGSRACEHARNMIDTTIAGDMAGWMIGRAVYPHVFDVPNDKIHIDSVTTPMLDAVAQEIFGKTDYAEFLAEGALLPGIVGTTAYGKNALRYNTYGLNNTGLGDSALGFTTIGSANTATGYVCGEGNVVGSRNSWYGQGIRVYQVSGDDNAQMGYGIGLNVGGFLNWLPGGSRNSNVGAFSLTSWQGDDVASVGFEAFRIMNGGAGGDVGVGARTGRSISIGGRNLMLGCDSGNHAEQRADVQNSIAIGADTWTTESNQVVIGNAANDNFIFGGVDGPSFTKADFAALKALVAA
ncbi:hypothetical protein AAG593_09780 [Citromicrobium bathyomarinum]